VSHLPVSEAGRSRTPQGSGFDPGSSTFQYELSVVKVGVSPGSHDPQVTWHEKTVTYTRLRAQHRHWPHVALGVRFGSRCMLPSFFPTNAGSLIRSDRRLHNFYQHMGPWTHGPTWILVRD
ncbi:hypothetical protein BD311DRAFT_662149, partial [Dichomitus squalens]